MNRKMQYYLIEPKDPLIIRSGRPFEEISDADAARFPPPSTLAGALRNSYARSAEMSFDSAEHTAALLEMPVFGPLAVKLQNDSTTLNPQTLLVPKPADAHYVAVGEETAVQRAIPMLMQAGEGCDLPEGLMPVQMSVASNAASAKPVSGPQWWSLADLLQWRQGTDLSFAQIQDNGWIPAPADIRTHVAINQSARNAESGRIFQTTGMSLWQRKAEGEDFPSARIGILGGINAELSTSWLNLGGERRLAGIQPVAFADTMDETWANAIQHSSGLSLTLLTPALFANGWLPGWLDENTLIGTPPGCTQLQVKLIAAATPRWQAQSGWDLAKRRPRCARRAVAAGATYWFERVTPEPSTEDLQALWFGNLCDDPNDNRNGFGLALPAAYTPGKLSE